MTGSSGSTDSSEGGADVEVRVVAESLRRELRGKHHHHKKHRRHSSKDAPPSVTSSATSASATGGISGEIITSKKVSNKDIVVAPPSTGGGGGGINITPGTPVPSTTPASPAFRFLFNPPPPPVAPEDGSDVIVALQKARYSITGTNLARSGILDNAKGWTLFAPSNFAWRRWMINTTSDVGGGLGSSNGGTVVTRLMQYHILGKQYAAADLKSAGSKAYPTLFPGASLQVTPRGALIKLASIPVENNPAYITKKDFLVGDGLITVHLINNVLQPDPALLLAGFAPAPAPSIAPAPA